MKTLISIICLLPFFGAAQTGKIMIPYHEGNRWGFCDTLGNIIIKPMYQFTSNIKIGNSFSKLYNGFGIVEENNNCGVVNDKGSVIVPIEYSYIVGEDNKGGKGFVVYEKGTGTYKSSHSSTASGSDYLVGSMSTPGVYYTSSGQPLAYLPDHSKTYYDSKTGMVYPQTGQPFFNNDNYFASKSYEGEYRYRGAGEKGFYTQNGKQIIASKFDMVCLQDDGFFIVGYNDKFGVIDPQGVVVAQPKYDDIFTSEQVLKNNNIDFKKSYIGRIDSTYYIVSKQTGQSVETAPLNRNEANMNAKNGEANEKIATKIDASKKLYVIKKDDKQGVATSDKLVLPAKYDSIICYLDLAQLNGTPKLVFGVMKNKKAGVVDCDGNIVLPFDYDGLAILRDCGAEKGFLLIKSGVYGAWLPSSAYKLITPRYESLQIGGTIPIDKNRSFVLFNARISKGNFGIVGENGIEYFKFNH
jgi:hypothetical protein